MKQFFSAVGKALVYFLILIGAQTIVPFLYGIASVITHLPQVFENPNAVDTLLQSVSDSLLTDLGPMLLLSNLTALFLYFLTAPIRRRSLRAHFDLNPMDRLSILPLLLLGICCNLAINVLLGLIPFPEAWWQSYEASAELVPMDLSVLAVFSTAFLGPFVEELCFRGLMYTRLRRAMPGIAAALISSVIFGAVHGTLIWFFYAFPLGLLMVWLFHRFGSLWASILFHMTFNLTNFLLLPLPEAAILPLSILGCLGCAGCTFWVLRLTKPSQSRT